MVYVVAFGLLVAAAAWLVAVYNKLNFLREQVQVAWLQWSRATVQRNECLGHFAAAMAANMPGGSVLSVDLQRLADDSCLAIMARQSAPRPGGLRRLREMEVGVRRRVGDFMLMIERDKAMRTNADLQQGWRDVSAAFSQQEKIARLYDRSAGDYNNALVSQPARTVAHLFGFLPVAQMSHRSPWDEKKAAGDEPAA